MNGTRGYADDAARIFAAYESVTFRDVHRAVLHLIPATPSRILDVGAGSGRDAAALTAMEHDVVAVEPVAALRVRAIQAHPSPRIVWLDDRLPELARLPDQGCNFHLVKMTAVWMHLDRSQRQLAMPRVASLLAAGGVAILSLRHGPVPAGRVMFEVAAEETVCLAARAGLSCILNCAEVASALPRTDVTCTWLAFEK